MKIFYFHIPNDVIGRHDGCGVNDRRLTNGKYRGYPLSSAVNKMDDSRNVASA